MAAFAEQIETTDPGCSPGAYDSRSRSRQPINPQPPTAPSALAPHRRAAVLTRFVETEILPRLAALRAPSDVGPIDASNAPVLTPVHTEEFVRLVLSDEAAAAGHYVDALRARGVTARALYLGLLTDSARLLGEFWEADRCSFVEVTIGMVRLQLIARSLSPSFQAAAIIRAQPESVLLLPAPGEQHTYGLAILGEFFQCAGWRVARSAVASGEAAADLVRDTWFDVAGFSIGAEVALDRLASCIRLVRCASCNRRIRIMVGGPLFHSRSDLVLRVGADAGASDAPGALRQARDLLHMQAAGTG